MNGLVSESRHLYERVRSVNYEHLSLEDIAIELERAGYIANDYNIGQVISTSTLSSCSNKEEMGESIETVINQVGSRLEKWS